MSDYDHSGTVAGRGTSAWLRTIPFRRALRPGAVGQDVLAVKRALARAGHGPKRLRGLTPVYGPYTRRHVQALQRKLGIRPTGYYGPATHRALLPWFDERAAQLYGTGKRPVEEEALLLLPEWFRPSHPTGGLAGYPAVDVFGDPGQWVGSPCAGTVVRFSGKDPKLGGRPGSAYGWSMYVERSDGRGRYYLTHFGGRAVRVGQVVRKGQRLGTICDSAVSGKPGTSHIHEGYHSHGRET